MKLEACGIAPEVVVVAPVGGDDWLETNNDGEPVCCSEGDQVGTR